MTDTPSSSAATESRGVPVTELPGWHVHAEGSGPTLGHYHGPHGASLHLHQPEQGWGQAEYLGPQE